MVDRDGRLVDREERERVLRELGIDLELEREPDVYDFAESVLCLKVLSAKADGHGFGLHNSANAAGELGASLIVDSDGPGQGATFWFEFSVEASKPIGIESCDNPSG